MHPVLILDGHLKGALCAARTLGRQGIPVAAAAERPTAMALHSRHARRRLVYPDPKHDPDGFLKILMAELQQLHETHQKPVVVYSFSDATMTLLSEHYEQLKDYMLMSLPARESLAIAFDKERTAEYAHAHNIPTMPAVSYEDRHEMTYPVVVKPRHSVVWQAGKAAGGTATFVFSPPELSEVHAAIAAATGEAPLIQKFVTGGEYGIEGLCADGEILLEFAHKRIRSLSPRGGAAVVKETASDTPEVQLMRQYATLLIRSLEWVGPIMFEFKLDESDSSVRLMEINGRWWGSLPLPQTAGVDFVSGYYSWVTKGTVSQPSVATPRTRRTYHFLGDVKWLLQALFAKDRLRPYVYPTRLRALKDFGLEMFRGRSDVFSVIDPKPSLYEVIDILKR